MGKIDSQIAYKGYLLPLSEIILSIYTLINFINHNKLLTMYAEINSF